MARCRPDTLLSSFPAGRSGVLMLVEAGLLRAKSGNAVDLVGLLRDVRAQRPGMVQTEDQFKFCFDAVLHMVRSLVEA